MDDVKMPGDGPWTRTETVANGVAEPEITTTRAIAIAAGAAALAGGISALFSRRPPEPVDTKIGAHVGATVERAVGLALTGSDQVAKIAGQGLATGRDAVSERTGTGKDALGAIAAGASTLGAKVSDVRESGATRVLDGYGSARDSSQRGGQRVAEEIENLARRLQSLDPARFGSILQGTRGKTGDIMGTAAESFAASLSTTSGKARQVLPEGTGPAVRAVEARAKEIGHQVVAGGVTGRDRLADARGAVNDASLDAVGATLRDTLTKLRDDVSPIVRDAAVQAAARAIELWETGRQDAQDALSGDALKDVTGKATALTARARDTTAHAVSRASNVAVGTSAELAARTADLAARSADSRERLQLAGRHAAAATGETSKEAGSAAVWAAIAGGIVYYALLDEKRREQVNRYAQSLFGGARELVRDIQGYDADF